MRGRRRYARAYPRYAIGLSPAGFAPRVPETSRRAFLRSQPCLSLQERAPQLYATLGRCRGFGPLRFEITLQVVCARFLCHARGRSFRAQEPWGVLDRYATERV